MKTREDLKDDIAILEYRVETEGKCLTDAELLMSRFDTIKDVGLHIQMLEKMKHKLNYKKAILC